MHRITQKPNVGQADGLEKYGKVSPAGRYAATMLQARGVAGRTMTRDRGRKEVEVGCCQPRSQEIEWSSR